MKSLSLFWAALFVFVSTPVCMADQIANLASEMATGIEESGKKAIAVADFTDLEGQNTKLGRFLAEEFFVALAASGKGFQVIDRLHLKSLIREHELSESGIIDTTTAQKLGNIAGVEALITGTLTPFGDTIRVTAKILDTKTARIIGAMTGDLPKTGAFAKLVESEIREAIAAQSHRTPMLPQSKDEEERNQSGYLKEAETPNFKYSLANVTKNGEIVELTFIVISKAKDNKLYIDKKKTRIFDDTGNEFNAYSARLGNKKGTSYGVGNTLISGIPTKLILTFKGLSKKAKYIAMLELVSSSSKIQLKNISL